MQAPDISGFETDFLTKCFAKVALPPFLEAQILKAETDGMPLSVVFIDLDGFKFANDTYGHVFGDEALKYFASTLRLSLESEDPVESAQRLVFRYGGDEFVVLILGKDAHEAKKIISGVLYNIKRRRFLYRGKQFSMTFSAGVASFPLDAESAVSLVENADKALYSSKKRGKGRVTIFSRMSSWSFKKIAIFTGAAVVVLSVLVFLVVFFAYIMEWVK